MAETPFIQGCTGFACANFSVGGEVTPGGKIFDRILINPPVIGVWLEEWGRGELAVDCGGLRWTAESCQDVKALRCWPQASVQWADTGLAVRLRVDAWAPVRERDMAATSLPVLVARLWLDGRPGQAVALEYTVRRQEAFTPTFSSAWDMIGRLDYFDDFGLGWDQLEKGDTASFERVDDRGVRSRLELTLPDSGNRVLYLYLLFWNPAGRSAADFADLPALHRGMRQNRANLERDTALFGESLPPSGDAKVDEYLRWYMTAGVMLTRILKDNTTLTMGYAELNQRDSFWTSYPHLHYWPDAERKMLEESAAAVTPSGKVPTCIFPTIERGDDLDINEYFLLRVARYHQKYSDVDFAKKLWPTCQRAMNFLLGRCAAPSALPEQESFWADWKDVDGITGRKFGPHFTGLYLACLQEWARLAREMGQAEQAVKWEAAFGAGRKQMNLPVESGGQWNGKYYVNVWRDGRKDDALLEDQMVAGVWGVIPQDRFDSIRSELNARAEKPWGVRETVPYYDRDGFGYEGGDYHNGGVWPWLNCADVMARCRYGYPEDGLRILRKLGEWDLEKGGDFLPHENLHGEDGRCIRSYIQGWDAAYLGAVMALRDAANPNGHSL